METLSLSHNLFSSIPARERSLRLIYWLIVSLFILILYYFWEPLRSTRVTYSFVSISIGNTVIEVLFRIITTLGSEGFFLALFAIIYWSFDRTLGLFGLLIMPLSIFITSEVPKDILRLPRPDIRGVAVPTYTFPSGHTSGAVCVWGYLAIMLKRPWLWALSITTILLVGLSRIILGYHYPGDVIGGIVTGMIFLFFFFYLGTKVVATGFHQMVSNHFFLFIALAIPLSLSFLPVFFGPRLMGYMTGAGLGYLLARDRLNFEVEGTWQIHVMRNIVGLLILLFITLGLDGIIPIKMHLLKYTQYALATLWITFLAPLVFMKCR